MIHTAKHLADTQTKLGHTWVIEDVQLENDDDNAAVQTESTSDPICSSAGCTQYPHKKAALGYPIDYFVPHFGQDVDAYESMDSIKLAELAHTHNLIMGKPESLAKWHNPAADTL